MPGPLDWSAIGPLPTVAPWNKGKRTYSWQQRCADYAALTKTGIVVVAELLTPVLHAEQLWTHLDGILSAAAITDHPHPSTWEKAAIVPLPIDLAWVSPQGLPLWACSPLVPMDDGIVSRECWHKRYPSHRADLGDKQSANTSAGRWREYRMPVSAHAVDKLTAIAIGNAAEVQRLLDGVTHIGKKGSMGYGRVGRWQVIESAHTLDDVLQQRPVPVSSGLVSDGQVEPMRGWTPPYWYAPHWVDCVVPA